MPRRSRIPTALSATAATVTAVLAVGCAVPEPLSSVRPASPPELSRATAVTYEISGRESSPIFGPAEPPPAPGPSPTEFSGVGGENPTEVSPPSLEVAESADDPRTPRRCSLELRRTASGARARLLLSDEPAGPAPSREPEAYELDLAAAELSLILDDLDASGFFGGQERPTGGSTVAVSFAEERMVRKTWTPEPRLDDLAERVYREGRRVPVPKVAGHVRLTAGRD